MLIRMAFGSQSGDVVDVLPHEARAMLEDGRATLPAPEGVSVASPSVVSQHVAGRSDHVPDHAKHRRRR